MDTLKQVTFDDMDRARDAFLSDRANIVAKNACTSVGVRTAARVPEAVAKNTSVFDVELVQGDRCDQMHSGRCWMFASLNTYRYHIIHKYNLKTYELSQVYPLFYDKLEKSNWFFEQILDTLDDPREGRTISYLLTDPICDGGQWDMFKSLTKKYGIVPKEAMPEVANSRDTRQMDSYLTRYLRSGAMRLRKLHAEGAEETTLREIKKTMMDEVYRLLTICLGEPPQSFDVRVRDKDDKLVLEGTYTPQSFYDEVCGIQVDDYVSLISAPTEDKPFNHTYTVSRLGNVVEDGQVLYLNLPIESLKRAAVKQLKAGIPVWFGCDVDQSYIQKEGLMDIDSLDVDGLFGFAVESALNRAERLDWGESVMTHAMVFEGVNFNKDGNTTLWKVENSWGKDRGKDGFDSITDKWFDEYVYQVVVDKQFLSNEERALLDEQPRELAPWDPMGTLAQVH